MDKLIYYQTQLQKVCLQFSDAKNLQVQGTQRKLASGRPAKGSEMCTYVQNVGEVGGKNSQRASEDFATTSRAYKNRIWCAEMLGRPKTLTAEQEDELVEVIIN